MIGKVVLLPRHGVVPAGARLPGSIAGECHWSLSTGAYVASNRAGSTEEDRAKVLGFAYSGERRVCCP